MNFCSRWISEDRCVSEALVMGKNVTFRHKCWQKGEQQEFCVWVSQHNRGCCFCVCIWPDVLCWVYTAHAPRSGGSLGSEGRTSAQHKHRAGRGRSVVCWLFAVPDNRGLPARPLWKWGCLQHVVGREVTDIPHVCSSQAWSGWVRDCLVQMRLDFQESWLLWKPDPWQSGSKSPLSCRI